MIDVIFHEMRNPLNGIYQNADLITDSIVNIRKQISNFRNKWVTRINDLCSTTTPELSAEFCDFIESIEEQIAVDLESLDALNLCAKHQKRIADDVLQMSKLSLNLVSLSEKPFKPLVETTSVIRMFEREAFTKGISLTFVLGEGYRRIDVGWVLADPTRFGQVLVNLISNALRFTENAPTRSVEVTLDASEEVPNLVHSLKETKEIYHHSSSAHRENPLFLISSIRDSGVGLTLEERSSLFQKFSQASPKTYSQYGGSGLGLFISKALVEVQGGHISLESEKHRGTTVTFYIQCSPASAPERPPPEATSLTKHTVDDVVAPPRTLNVLIVEDNLV